MDTELPVTDRIGHVIKRAEQSVIAAKTAVLRDTGLTVPQYAALLTLSHTNGISGSELARQCSVTPQTMATMLTALHEKGYVLREPSPLHAQVLVTRLSRSGQAILRKADDRAVALERQLADAYEPGEVEQLRELLERAIALLDNRRSDLRASG